MFAPQQSLFWDPWLRARFQGYSTAWQGSDVPWVEPEGFHSGPTHAGCEQRSRTQRRRAQQHSRRCREQPSRTQVFTDPIPVFATPTSAPPLVPQPVPGANDNSSSASEASTSRSSYYSTESDAAEPMDFCYDTATSSSSHRGQHGLSSAHATASSFGHGTGSRSAHNNAYTRTWPGNNTRPAPAAASNAQQKQKQQPAANPAQSRLSPDAAATIIQAAWRMYSFSKHRQAVKQLASASAQLRNITSQFEAVKQEAAASGVGVTQKQYLELSEPVMKVLFLLDSVSCGPAVELRGIRKRLTTSANKLLDDIQAAYKAGYMPVPPQQQQQNQQQQQQPKQQQPQQQQPVQKQPHGPKRHADGHHQQHQQQRGKSSRYQQFRNFAGF